MAKKKFVKQSKAKLAFRKAQSYQVAPLVTLSQLRKNISINEYKDCIQQFCIFGKLDANTFLQLGKEKPEELVGQYIGLEPANSNMRCDSLKSLMIINKLSKFL